MKAKYSSKVSDKLYNNIKNNSRIWGDNPIIWNYQEVYYCLSCEEIRCFKMLQFKTKAKCCICDSLYEGYVFLQLLRKAVKDKIFRNPQLIIKMLGLKLNGDMNE